MVHERSTPLMKKQTLILVLLACLLLNSCGGTTVEETPDTAAQTAETETVETETAYPLAVAEAAYACGFENIGYFCRYYKKITGEMPSETGK